MQIEKNKINCWQKIWRITQFISDFTQAVKLAWFLAMIGRLLKQKRLLRRASSQ
jgi:hypothetical protein